MTSRTGAGPTIAKRADDFRDFYARNAERYASHQIRRVQRVWSNSSHPLLEGNHSLIDSLVELAPGPRGLDAGCGAGAVDVADLVDRGLDVVGIDAVPGNVEAALRLHPSLEGRIRVGDLSRRLDMPSESFDFAMCNAVIQHLGERTVHRVTIPELCRVLAPGGVLQLVFKCGRGVISVHDPDYGELRSFRLFDERRVLSTLQSRGMELIDAPDPSSLGGLMYFTNNNGLRHCAVWTRRAA